MASAAPAQPSSPTPILDGLLPLPQRRKGIWSVVVQMAIGAIVGIVLALAGIKLLYASGNNSNPFMPLLILVDIYAALYLGIIIHECGHLVAGLSAGLRLNYVRFGPLQINPPFKVTWQPKLGIGAAGLASLLPRNQHSLHRNVCLFLLGGPVANIVVATILYVGFRPLSLFWGTLALICALLGVSNLVPFVQRGAVSDGKRFLMVLRRTHQGERWLAIFRLSGDLWKGAQPEHFDAEQLRAGLQFTDNLPDTAAIHALAYASAFRRHQDVEAARLLEVALAHSAQIPIAGRESLIAEAAVFQARRARNLESAQAWLKRLPPKTQRPGLREQGQAALLECESKLDEALAKLEQSAHLISAMPPGMQRDVSLRSLERWKQELAEQKARSAGQEETQTATPPNQAAPLL